jgi:two-component system, response regulator PdtaR
MNLNAKILIVEDESIVALDLKQQLENMDYTVVGIAGNGNEAIEKTRVLSPDIVLMDILLKGELDGIETAQKIRDTYNIPFIYLTGSYDNEILERIEISQPLGYLKKPYDRTELHNIIQIAINNTEEPKIKKTK